MKPRYGAVLVAAVLVATGVSLLLSRRGPERSWPKPRLVLLYAPCTVNKRFLAPYNPSVGYTPFLARFAADAIVFERHQSQSDQSGVAYAALFSGTETDRHGIFKHPTMLSDRSYLVAEAFSDAGYETFFWSAQPMASAELNYGQGVPAANTYVADGSPTTKLFLRAADPRFRSLLDGLQRDPSRHAFLMTNFSVTHGPYTPNNFVAFCRSHRQECPPLEVAETWKFMNALNDHPHEWSYDFEGTKSRLGFDEEETARFIRFAELLYKSNVWYLDNLFGAMLQEIAKRNLLDESLIVFTADHGEVLFRDNAPYKWTHGFSLAPEDLEVPLIVRSPRLDPGRYGGVTRSIDVFPTIAGLAGIEIRSGEVSGENLSSAMRAKKPGELLAFSHTALIPDLIRETLNPRFPSLSTPFPREDPALMWVQVRRRDLVYKITNRDGKSFRAEVYDWQNDPSERHNLYDPDDRSQRDMFRQLEAYKQRLIEAYGRLKAAGEGRLPTEREKEILRSLGYIE